MSIDINSGQSIKEVNVEKTALKNNTTLKFETLKTGLINKKDY